MIPQELKQLIEKYCMGMQPTDAQIDEIFDKAITLGADAIEVTELMEKLQKGPTREQLEAQRKAEEAERKRKEAEEAKRKRLEAEQKEREEAERKAREEAERKKKAEAAKKRKETIEAKKEKEAEASEKAFMNIKKIEFANDGEKDFISGYGEELNDKDMRYLTARITYDSLLDWDKTITMYEKIINPDGTLRSSSSSPEGYTKSASITVEKGNNQRISFPGWGNASKSTYEAGVYQYELWYGDKLIYKSSFEVKATKASITINKLFFNNTDKKNAAIICQGVVNNIEKSNGSVVLQLYLNGIHFGGGLNNKVYSTTQDVEINKSGEFEARFILNENSFYEYKLKRSNGINEFPSYIRWGKDPNEGLIFNLTINYKKRLLFDEFEITKLTSILDVIQAGLWT